MAPRPWWGSLCPVVSEPAGPATAPTHHGPLVLGFPGGGPAAHSWPRVGANNLGKLCPHGS